MLLRYDMMLWVYSHLSRVYKSKAINTSLWISQHHDTVLKICLLNIYSALSNTTATRMFHHMRQVLLAFFFWCLIFSVTDVKAQVSCWCKCTRLFLQHVAILSKKLVPNATCRVQKAEVVLMERGIAQVIATLRAIVQRNRLYYNCPRPISVQTWQWPMLNVSFLVWRVYNIILLPTALYYKRSLAFVASSSLWIGVIMEMWFTKDQHNACIPLPKTWQHDRSSII